MARLAQRIKRFLVWRVYRRITRFIRTINVPVWGAKPGRGWNAVNPDDFPREQFPTPCMHCGYDVSKSPSVRCPECGRRIFRGRDSRSVWSIG